MHKYCKLFCENFLKIEELKKRKYKPKPDLIFPEITKPP